MNSIDSTTHEIHSILRERKGNYVAASEALISKLVDLRDPRIISCLVGCFDDSEQYDDLMFSIIHAIEVFDDSTYAREVLATLPEFFTNAPRWCSIVHMRILNSPSALKAYQREVEHADEVRVAALRNMLVQMGTRGGAIAEKTVPLLRVLPVNSHGPATSMGDNSLTQKG